MLLHAPEAPLISPDATIFKPKPTARAFICSPTMYNVIVSARGGGKTSAASWSNVHWAFVRHTQERMPLPVRYAVIRDTRRNIGRTVAKTLKEWFPPPTYSVWKGKEEEPEWAQILDPAVGPLVEYYFIGCDHPSDLDIFQSFEIGGLWIVEPAPAGTESNGIDASVFAMAVSSSRQNAWFRAVIEFNHPPPDHWVCQVWPEVLPDPEAAIPSFDVPADVLTRFRQASRVFKIPREENAAESKTPGYLERMRDAFLMANRPDLAARLVDGEVADVQMGEPVVAHFQPAVHVVPSLTPVVPGDRLIAGWDGGHQPACVIARARPGQGIELLAAFQAEHAGMLQFLQAQVLPWLAGHVPDGVRWQHTGDPNLKTGDQSNIDSSAFRTIMQYMPVSYGVQAGGWVQGPVSQKDRENPVHTLLNPDWRPPLRFDARYAQPLIRGLSGRWRRPKDPSGHIIAGTWLKTLEANTCEAFAYICALFHKRQSVDAQITDWKRRLVMRQASQYSSGSLTNV